LFVFKQGREKSLSTSDFIKWIAKNAVEWRRVLKLREFSHNHHPSGVKMLAKFIRRGFSVPVISAKTAGLGWPF